MHTQQRRSQLRAQVHPGNTGLRPAVRAWFFFLTMLTALAVFAAAAQARGAPESFSGLAEKVIPSVVTISTTQAMATAPRGLEDFNLPPGSPFEEFFKDFFEKRQQPQDRPRQRPTSLGSGFIIDGKGFVVTNNHVIDGADEIKVVLHDETILEAELVGTDPETDLAVLRVDATGHDLKAVKFGNSDIAKVGDWVVAVGNPFGLGSTMTAGIISARGRDINAGRYDDFIQTDAPINKGNSGGPLFDMSGEVIGVNTMIFSPSGGNVGIGFSVPAAVAKPIVKQLIDSGRVRRGWLGVRIQVVTEEIAESLDLGKARGALVASVNDGSPAAAAGISAGDVILRFNNRRVTEMRKLPRIVADTPVGEAVDVILWRDGKRVTTQVTVGELKEEVVASAEKKPQTAGASRDIAPLGVTVADLSPALRDRYELNPEAKGVLIVGLEEDGPAARKNINVGDVIVEISQVEVGGVADVDRLVKDAQRSKRKSVLLMLEGQGGVRFVAVRLTE